MAKMPGVDEGLVKALVTIVDLLPRGFRKDADGKLTDIPYTGVLARDVATVFYDVMAKREHALADVKNENCSFDVPCGKCRRDVLQVTSDSAESKGLVVRIGRSKEVTQKNGKQGRFNWVTYYRPGELKGSKNLQDVAAKVLEML